MSLQKLLDQTIGHHTLVKLTNDYQVLGKVKVFSLEVLVIDLPDGNIEMILNPLANVISVKIQAAQQAQVPVINQILKNKVDQLNQVGSSVSNYGNIFASEII